MSSTLWWNTWWAILIAAATTTVWIPCTAAAESETEGRGRGLTSLKEIQGNTSFNCSPSGRCALCQYHEKNDKNYRCSETGYRMPFKCVEIQGSASSANKNLQRRFCSFDDPDVTFGYSHPTEVLKLQKFAGCFYSITGQETKSHHL